MLEILNYQLNFLIDWYFVWSKILETYIIKLALWYDLLYNSILIYLLIGCIILANQTCNSYYKLFSRLNNEDINLGFDETSCW